MHASKIAHEMPGMQGFCAMPRGMLAYLDQSNAHVTDKQMPIWHTYPRTMERHGKQEKTRCAGLPDNSACMLFMTRGTGTERRSGLLLVPKLDYLQLLAVEWVRDAAKAAGRAVLRAVADLSVRVHECGTQIERKRRILPL
jgi:hypothetical protein